MHDGPPCDACGWEVRDSDRYCSFCGTLQRSLEFTPPTLSLGVLERGGVSGEQISAGRLVLTTTGLLPVRVLAVEGPAGVTVTTEPPLPPPSHGGFLLPLQRALTVTGRQVGDVAAESAMLVVTTSIGTLRLPIRTEPPPEISLEPQTIRLPEGKPSVVTCDLALAEGSHRVRITVSGTGLRLRAPAEEVRLIAGVPLGVELEADPSVCVAPERPARLAVDLGWTSLAFELRFETVVPGRLLPAGGRPNIDFRIFPGDREERLVPLRNLGSLPFLVEEIDLRTDDGNDFAGVEIALLEEKRHQSLPVPAEIPPDATVILRLRCDGGEPPGLRQSGTLTLGGSGMEALRLAFLLDTREPADHRLPVGLDFGTSASSVATRRPQESRPGRVVSLPFRSPIVSEGGENGTYLPSDVQIVRNPTTGEPVYEIDWNLFNEDWHLLFARNLKRRVGLRGELREGTETVFIDGRRFDIPVEDLAVFVIREMRRQAEREIGARIREGLATVPTRFSLRRIHAIRELYRRAGFERIALIDESVAAGILGMYYQFHDRSDYTMLVYDMGGGTTDVTLFRVENRKVGNRLEIHPQILGVAGDPQLGGRDVTDLMVQRVIDNLSPEERESLLWPDKVLDAPELQLVAKRNANELFTLAEKAKLELFDGDKPPASATVKPSLWVSPKEASPFTGCSFTAEAIQEPIRPRLERLWRQILDVLQDAALERLDILYVVGRSSRLPIIHQKLSEFLAEHARSPGLETVFATDREGRGVLKEAVSLGACLARDLLFGISERLVLAQDGEQMASRFGIRDQGGSFLELLPSGWRIGQPSKQRIPLRLASPFNPGIYESRLEVWENLTPSPRVDDNPDAELLGTAHIELSAEELGPADPDVEVGMVLEENRTLHLLVHWNGETRKVPIES